MDGSDFLLLDRGGRCKTSTNGSTACYIAHGIARRVEMGEDKDKDKEHEWTKNGLLTEAQKHCFR